MRMGAGVNDGAFALRTIFFSFFVSAFAVSAFAVSPDVISSVDFGVLLSDSVAWISFSFVSVARVVVVGVLSVVSVVSASAAFAAAIVSFSFRWRSRFAWNSLRPEKKQRHIRRASYGVYSETSPRFKI